MEDDSFYALLADHGEELFDDYDFEYLYCDDNGRPCVPPGQMFILLLLQMHDRCSDYEAVERARWDLRWSSALDIEPTVRLCGRSTLQEFRARVLLHEVAEKQFKSIIGLARKLGIVKGPLQVAIDTTPIFGRGAVRDTYNLIGDGIRKVGQTLARLEGDSAERWAARHHFTRYWDASSLKGEAEIDWNNDAQRRVFLNGLVADAERILHLADTRSKEVDENQAHKISEASALLRRIIIQDTEPDPNPPKGTGANEASLDDLGGAAATPSDGQTSTSPGATVDGNEAPQAETLEIVTATNQDPHLLSEMVRIRQGTVKDRIISVFDPEMRHGRKSASNLFNGHKLSIVNDTDNGLILSLGVLHGNAGDNEGALELVVQARENSGLPVEKAVADCAFGDGTTRQSFHDANIVLSAKVPAPRKNDQFPKSRFLLDLTSKVVTATCPEAKTTAEFDMARSRHGTEPTMRFRFSTDDCSPCPHRDECLRSIDKSRGWGRSLSLHPQEELLQQARRHQASPEFREDIRARQSVERSLAWCTAMGARQARYTGRRKTEFQMLMVAMVVNLKIIRTALIARELAQLSLAVHPRRLKATYSKKWGLISLQGNPRSSRHPSPHPRPGIQEIRGFRLAS